MLMKTHREPRLTILISRAASELGSRDAEMISPAVDNYGKSELRLIRISHQLFDCG